MTEQAVKLLEARVLEAVDRLRELAAERDVLLAEVDRLRDELAALTTSGRDRADALRSVLNDAIREMKEE